MTPGAEPARAGAPSFLAERVPLYQQRIESVLARALEIEGGATPRLLEAMRYSTLGGGKRVRPVLVYATGEALGATLEQLDCAAASTQSRCRSAGVLAAVARDIWPGAGAPGF